MLWPCRTAEKSLDRNRHAYRSPVRIGTGGSVKSGIRAAFSVPVIDAQGRVLGSLASHYRKPFSPTAYEIERNHLFATLIAFALVRDWDHNQQAKTAEVI